ncbi:MULTISPECIES: hypothetical protein [unclassified Microcoleus]|uniref:hypothetical protein n=1 Tax=unclassified Microcoleus TaxID=2642155 RepID=UPI002FD6EFBF
MAASINGASHEQISLLAGDRAFTSTRSPGSFRVSTKKSKNGATIGNPLEPGKFCRADNRQNIGGGKLTNGDRIAQIFINSCCHGGGLVADHIPDSAGKVAGDRWWRQQFLKLLTLNFGKVRPNGGAIGLATLTAILQNCCDLVGGRAIGFRDCGADELKALSVGSTVNLYGRSGLLLGF